MYIFHVWVKSPDWAIGPVNLHSKYIGPSIKRALEVYQLYYIGQKQKSYPGRLSMVGLDVYENGQKVLLSDMSFVHVLGTNEILPVISGADVDQRHEVAIQYYPESAVGQYCWIGDILIIKPVPHRNIYQGELEEILNA